MRIIAQAQMTESRTSVIESGRDLSALFGLDPEAQQ